MNYEKFKLYEKRAQKTVYSEEGGSFHDVIIEKHIKTILPQLNIDKESKILDIGCGPGVFLQAAKKEGYTDLVGVTLSKEDVEICKKLGFQTLHDDMSDLSVDDDSIDLVWCRHALEHSPYPLFTLYEFHRVLKDQALAFIEVPAPDNDRVFVHENNPNHYSIMGERMWLALFYKSGFDVVSFHHYKITTEVIVVPESSYLFVIKKSTESIAEKFLRDYDLKISDD
jgi:SAM-dependent methyltransferase